MRVLESERLLLKPIDVEDLKYLCDLRWNKEVTTWIIHEPISYKQQLEWYNSLKKTDVALSIFYKSEKSTDITIIGTIGLYDIHPKHQRAKWSLRITPEYWGKGIAKEVIKMFLDYVFNTMNVNKLMGDCFVENVVEVNVLTKMGFTSEGVWREHYFHKGKFRDSIQFTMLRREYIKQNDLL